MRDITEIKFRGKRTDNGEWVEGDLTLYSKAVSYITVDLIENQVYEVHTDTVGQFTHSKDKNGREIYENSVVQRILMAPSSRLINEDFIGQVKFYEGAWWIDNGCDAIPLWSEADELVVLGNIYENPELLGDSK